MHTDIEIIKEYIRNKTHANIEEITNIKGQEYTFLQQKIPGIPVYMTLPDGIRRMDPYLRKIKYPDENHADVILTVSANETIDFLFTQTKESVTEQDLSDVAQGIRTVIKRMHASAIFYETGEMQSKLSNICWFDYTTVALEADIYNLTYILCIDDRIFLGGFCCLREDRKQWQSLVLQMLATITDEEDTHV